MSTWDSSPTLLGLHQDLLVKVLLQLEPRDLQSVSCSCKALALTDSPLWQSLFFHKWDVPRGSHLNYKKLYFRREQLLRYLESVCSRLKPDEEPSLQTLHDGRRVLGAGRFATLCPSKHMRVCQNRRLRALLRSKQNPLSYFVQDLSRSC